MKIVDKYISLKTKHKNKVAESTGLKRITNQKTLIDLRKQCDILESHIIQGILNYTLDFNKCYSKLLENNLNEFLDHSNQITQFRINNSISLSVGYDYKKQDKLLEEYKKLCLQAWEDFIITSKEREDLDSYCLKYKIDKLKQKQIEEEVYRQVNKDYLNLNDIVKHYFITENYDVNRIIEVLKNEYDIQTTNARIEEYIKDLNNDLIGNEVDKQGKSNLLYTIKFQSTSVYVVCVNSNLNTNKEFEIGFNNDDPTSFKILLSKKHCESLSMDSLIDIITDGICYNTSNNDLNRFLDLKPVIKETVKSYLTTD